VSGRTDVCMVVKNQLWNDARVKKEARSLANAGLAVTIISRPEEGRPEMEDWNGIRVLRVSGSGAFRASLRSMLDGAGGESDGFRRRVMEAIRRNRAKRLLGDLVHSSVYQYRIFRHAVRQKAAVYHAHDLDTLPACAAAARCTGAALVYDSHELWLQSVRHLTNTPSVFMKLERLAESALAPRADAVIAVTPGRARVMEEMYPKMPVPTLVPNYPPLSGPYPRSREVRGELGSSGDQEFLFIYQGVLGLHRGLEQLVDACTLLVGLPLHVAIVGHDATGGAIREYARERDTGGILTFHEPVPSEELPRLTGSADAGLLLFQDSCMNHTLSLPNKLFEYMMSGLPVVASDLPEIGEVVRKHSSGMLVDASSPESVAEAMREMASDPAEAGRMGESGHRAAVELYTWSVSERILLGLYSAVTGRDIGPEEGVEP
jgi:glycosyltransferase involved in cell wall biosynthesis